MKTNNEFSEFVAWMKTQPDQTMVSAVIIRLWNKFKETNHNPENSAYDLNEHGGFRK